MGSSVSTPGKERADRLRSGLADACHAAAEAIWDADVLVLCTGAGFSADSGLAVYADVAKVPAYASRCLDYSDICQPRWLYEEPELFWGFWGQCFNDYRETAPHSGYEIIESWVDRIFRHSEVAQTIRGRLEQSDSSRNDKQPYAIEGCPGAFFVFTSNVDAHHFDWFRACEIRECHGNVELYQCAGREASGMDMSSSRCSGIWRAPVDFRFQVDKTSMLAPKVAALGHDTSKDEAGLPGSDEASVPRVGQVKGSARSTTLRHMPPGTATDGTGSQAAASFLANHPICHQCGGPARPAILMFGDFDWQDLDSQEKRWNDWTATVEQLATERKSEDGVKALRAVVLEIGAGGNVRTVRATAERTLRELLDAGAEAKLLRVNPDFPLPDEDGLASHVVSIMGKGLESLKLMDSAMGSITTQRSM
eukprot:gb/GFBE01049168.1/.p1 GENE.gb/GFBE01049168.1/~~gb/GFBE01049168.1/.p1  ORF type:complete len:422 (+),score=85.93 gb/GFBE01049168.1/:1-1266(+)